MAATSIKTKYMTEGEGGLSLAFLLGGLLCVFAAANAKDTAFAFHAWLSAAASLGALLLIVNRYFERSTEPAAQEIAGKPNYNFGPVKFAA
ncbi:MAG TPA: cytochrome C oxidase, partial [Beijerinckiaceae bacterium]